MSKEKENNIIMVPKDHQGNQEPLQGHNPSPGIYAPIRPTPAYQMGQPNDQSQPPPQHIVQQHVISMPIAVGPDPRSMPCPSCRQNIVTSVDHESSTMTHVIALILLLVACPCFWIPYATDSCKNANHYCPNCGSFIGTYKS